MGCAYGLVISTPLYIFLGLALWLTQAMPGGIQVLAAALAVVLWVLLLGVIYQLTMRKRAGDR